ncbi:hypothetical protein LTR95_000761 [Oleoguttula sp. CCFEE 5521]
MQKADGSPVYMCGVRERPDCSGPSPGDIARIAALYPRSSATTVLPAPTSGSNFRPMRVVVGDVTVTVRPHPLATTSPESGTGNGNAFEGYPDGFFDTLDFSDQVNYIEDALGASSVDEEQ